MSQQLRTAGDAMFSALRTVQCTCQHNVPYAGGQVEQVVTKQCARCRSMAAWTLAASEKSASTAPQLESKPGEQS